MYETLPTELDDLCYEITRYFARGALCILTETRNTKIALGKGTEATYIDAVWKTNNINVNTLAPEKIRHVVQPDYIVVEVKQQSSTIKASTKPTAA